MKVDMAERTRYWALAMTERGSVTGTPDESSFGPWLAGELAQGFGDKAEVWTFSVAPNDARHCVAMLVRGSGAQTVLLTGHYDTVTTADFGDLRSLATKPEALARALLARLRERAETGDLTPAERLAHDDLESGAFLPGRGLLDMKAGLAAGLSVAENFAVQDRPHGNLLFIAVPDEENASAGARAAAPELARISARLKLDIIAAINLDAIADTGDGTAGQAVALGTVGKVLTTAFVVGVPTHSGFPLNGINAGVLLSAIAARAEWAPELTDTTTTPPGTPASLLSLRDGKADYDVTTPATAFGTWNLLLHRRSPADALQAFVTLCAEAVRDCNAMLAARARRTDMLLPRIIRYNEVLAAASARNPGIDKQTAASLEPALSLPDRCRLVTQAVWTAAGLNAPAVIVGFGSVPYCPTTLSDSPAARRLDRAVRIAAEAADEPVAISDWFAGISDMSFFGEADSANLDLIARQTPGWDELIGMPATGAIAQIPTVNIGPWGRDYHTPLERMHVAYGFGVLPRLLAGVLSGVLSAT